MTTPSASDLAARRDLYRSIRMGAAAAVVFGTWAFFANVSHGVLPGLRAALVQVALSFSLTFYNAEAIHVCERRLGTSLPALIAAALGPALSADLVIAVTHAIAGTPEILRTMAPSMLIGVVNASLYVAWRVRARSVAAL